MPPIDDRAAVSRAMAEPSRRAILEFLRFGQKTVTEIVDATTLKQPNVSNHLGRLRQQGIVHSERIGRNIYYSIALPIVDLMLRMHENTAAGVAEAAGSRLVLSVNPDAALEGLSTPSDEVQSSLTPSPAGMPLSEWRESYFQALLAGQEDRAGAVINLVLSHRPTLETIYLDIFQWALNRVGDLYAQGLTDEAHEHLASAITERLMGRVAPFYTPVARAPYRALLGGVVGNWHTIGLRMLSDGLRSIGWETRFLGANVPTDSFVAMAASADPDLVVASCFLQEQVPELETLISRLRSSPFAMNRQSFRVAAGGYILSIHPELIEKTHADFSAHSLSDFMSQVRSLYPISPR